MNFEEKTESTSSKQPIFIVILLIALSGAGFYYFNQQILASMKSILVVDTEPYKIPKDPVLNLSVLESPTFSNLESFPDYASFREDDELTVTPFRANPFLPTSGVKVQSSTKQSSVVEKNTEQGGQQNENSPKNVQTNEVGTTPAKE